LHYALQNLSAATKTRSTHRGQWFGALSRSRYPTARVSDID